MPGKESWIQEVKWWKTGQSAGSIQHLDPFGSPCPEPRDSRKIAKRRSSSSFAIPACRAATKRMRAIAECRPLNAPVIATHLTITLPCADCQTRARDAQKLTPEKMQGGTNDLWQDSDHKLSAHMPALAQPVGLGDQIQGEHFFNQGANLS